MPKKQKSKLLLAPTSIVGVAMVKQSGLPLQNSRNESHGNIEQSCTFRKTHSHFRWYQNHPLHAGKVLLFIIQL